MRRASILLLVLFAACERSAPRYSLIGDPSRGQKLVTSYGCTSCHQMPGVAGTGMVGPMLDHIGTRRYLAGRFPNVPQNMVEWLRFPNEAKPHTGMPDLGVTDRDARDMAAYLYTLR